MRQCKICKKSFPNTQKYFYKTGKGYLRKTCKNCYNKRNTAWKKNNKDSVRKTNIKHYAKRKNLGLIDPEQRRLATIKWRKENPEKWRSYNANDVKILKEYYVRKTLIDQGFEKHKITDKIIEIKRKSLKLKRDVRNKEKSK